MTKGNKQQRKRVAKTLSKVFRKLEVGHHPPQHQQPPPQQQNNTATAPSKNSRLRKRQEFSKAHNSKSKNSEQAEFDREQASLHERCWKKDGQGKKNSSTRVIDLQPPIFSLAPRDDMIEHGIASLEGIGGSSIYMSNGLGEAASCFLLQQSQKKSAAEAATVRENRFAALLETENDVVVDPLPADQVTPTPIDATDKQLFRFPPPLLQVPRQRMTVMPKAPLISSLDCLDV
jgi:hypothetical protein